MTIIAFPSDIESCADHINGTIRNIFFQLETLAATVVNIWEELEQKRRKPSSKDLITIRSLIDDYLTASNSCMQGAGIVLEPGALQDSDMYLEWLRVVGPNHTAPLTLNFNQRSDSFYNYQNMPWFNQPRMSGHNTLVGPYVDLYGADMYILTFSVPILVQGRFVGIAGADIALQKFERQLLKDLVRLHNEALIVSEEGRVIAANTANWMVGDMAHQAFNRAENECRQFDIGGNSAHWKLVERPVKRCAA